MNVRARGRGHIWSFLTTSFLLCSLPGCSYLDFGGNDEKQFEVRFFWQNGPSIGPEDPDNPGFDKDGNKRPSPEVLATYTFPDIHAGMNGQIGPKGRITPTMGIELVEVKVPYLRWFNLQVQGGYQLVDLYLGKRFTSIFEVTVGPWIGWDFEADATAWGVGGTLIKF
jgi:hypothetical protein